MKLLKIDEVTAKVARSRAAVYAAVKRGEFPKPVAVGSRGVAWVDGELDTYIAQQIARRDAKRAA